jgi:hypothetical protein
VNLDFRGPRAIAVDVHSGPCQSVLFASGVVVAAAASSSAAVVVGCIAEFAVVSCTIVSVDAIRVPQRSDKQLLSHCGTLHIIWCHPISQPTHGSELILSGHHLRVPHQLSILVVLTHALYML